MNTVATAFPGLAVPSLELPQDGALAGYTRASNEGVTDTSLKMYQDVAEKVAVALVASLPVALAGCSPESVGMRACVEQLIDTRLARLFRRPVDAETRLDLLTLFDSAKQTLQATDAEALELVLTRALLSPRFLYEVQIGEAAPELGGGMRRLDGHEIAARVSYGLLRAAPDDALFAAATQGLRTDPAALAEQARRLLGTPAGRKALWSFHRLRSAQSGPRWCEQSGDGVRRPAGRRGVVVRT